MHDFSFDLGETERYQTTGDGLPKKIELKAL
jgi:hypothetical protein